MEVYSFFRSFCRFYGMMNNILNTFFFFLCPMFFGQVQCSDDRGTQKLDIMVLREIVYRAIKKQKIQAVASSQSSDMDHSLGAPTYSESLFG